jgi:hypothetical protein
VDPLGVFANDEINLVSLHVQWASVKLWCSNVCVLQSSADNRTPDNQRISITEHKYGQLSNIIRSISLLSRNLQLLYKVGFGLMTRYPDRISKLWYRALISGPDIEFSYSIRSDWSSGYQISGYRLKRQFDNPDSSGYQHLTVYYSESKKSWVIHRKLIQCQFEFWVGQIVSQNDLLF